MGEAPVVTLTNAIFLASIQKDASEFRVTRDETGLPTVDFCIGGVWQQEMRPPEQLIAPIIRRISVLANLPMYGRGQAVRGTMVLRLDETREYHYRVHVEGHGPELVAFVRLVRDP